jgi:copper ion binding protein
MKKIITIEGMSCSHCQRRVEEALRALDGVEAKVDLKKKKATVKYSKEIDDSILRKAVEEAGYEVVSVEEKKGLF